MIKYLITGLFLIVYLAGGVASAQTPISEEQANNFYYNCKEKKDPRMMPDTLDAFCACTSVQMMQNMSVEEAQIMAGSGQEARNALNKLLLDVYAPCMNYPIQDLVRERCMSDPKLQALGTNRPVQETCSCVGVRTGEWFVEEGRSLMRDLIEANPNIYDPINPIMESQDFRTQSYNHMVACLTAE